MIRNYDYFVNRVIQAYVGGYIPELWKDIKCKDSVRQKDSGDAKPTLMVTMNARLYEYKKYTAEKVVNGILAQIDELTTDDRNELGYEMLNKLIEHMKNAVWEKYWGEQLENLTRNSSGNLNFADVKD